MKKQAFIFTFGLLFSMATAQPKENKQLTTPFDKILTEQFKDGEPGATVLVARKGQIIYKKAFGTANLEHDLPMKTDHIFRIGSITKQFTAVAILQLMEQGKLDLQDEITRFIPDYPTHGYKITIEHLLTHTSGIQSYTGMKDYRERMNLDLSPEEMIDHFKNQPMKFAPGTEWDYSNSGYFLLGYIIEKISGKTYGQYLEENFFKVLGMNNSYYGNDLFLIKNRVGAYSKDDETYVNALPISMTQPYAAGSILSTVEDLFKWHVAVHSYKLVKKETLEKAFTNYKLSNGEETNYGYGWMFRSVQGSPTIEHGGGINGSTTSSIYLPEEDVFVAVFSNCDCHSPESAAVRLAALAIGKSAEYKEITLDEKTLQSYTGVYENEKGEQRVIRLVENKLISQRGRGPEFTLYAYEKDKFFFDDKLVTIEFTRDENNDIAHLTLLSRGWNEVWNKTDKPVPTFTEIKVEDKILEKYTGEYQLAPDFTITITKEQSQLFAQATGQDKFEIFPESETKFYLKINGAQLEFLPDESGNITSVLLLQGGRTMEAKKVK